MGALSFVVAIAENGVIGREGALPWHLPDDLRHFKAVTLGKPVLMGRRTLESIGRALPGRRNLVLSRGAPPTTSGVEGVATLDEALQRCAGAPELCVIGGAGVFVAALPLATRMYLTRVHASPPGDVHFPDVDWTQWREVARSEHAADERHAHAMSFITLERA